MARTFAHARKHTQTREAEILAQALAGAVERHRSGMASEAESLYEGILRVKPDHFDALHLLGVLRQQQGRRADALRLIDAALRVVPRSVDALSNRGVALKSLDRLDEALASYDRALEINPDQIDALANRARILVLLERFEEALEAAEAVLSRKADHVDALRNRGHALLKLDRPQQALADYHRVLAFRPGDVEALNNSAIVLIALNRFDDALASLEKVLGRAPDNVSALINRGNALNRLKRLDEALLSYDRALRLCPTNAEALNNRGIVLVELNRLDEALACYERAIAIRPDCAEIRYGHALARLTVGDFRAGWREYEWRWRSPRWRLRQRNFAQPQWLGDTPVEGRTVLLHAEQGMGDALQFVRYAPLLARRGARVVVEVPKPLTALLAQLETVAVLARGDSLPAFDLHCPLMSLPLAFGTDVATIPAEIPYLRAPLERVAKWQNRLGERRAAKVGVVWEGSALHEDNRNRSVPLAQFGVALSTPGIEFVSMQRDLAPEDATALRGHSSVLDIGTELSDFADSAALISLLDIVVSVDTAVAHLAGAMGKPVWILLPFSPDFRWMLDRADSPWYPTARLFRQSSLGDWNGPLGDVRRALVSIAGCG